MSKLMESNESTIGEVAGSIEEKPEMADGGRGRVNGKGRHAGDEIWEMEEVEPWGEPVEGDKLLDELAGVVRRFVVLPEWGAETVALWVLHTYAFELRDVSAYLGIESPEKRCGKTTLLMVLSELAHRPVVASNISSSAFFRVIEEMRPSLFIDEADTLLYGNDELRGVLNAGYTRKTAFVVRVTQRGRRRGAREVKGGEHSRGQVEEAGGRRLVKFSCWCPKVMAAIGRLPETLADRCIVIRMQRKTAVERCERLRNLDAGELRRKCVRFVRDTGERIAAARPELPEGLHDRAGDIWEPLLALADLAGGQWPGAARRAALELGARAQEDNPIGALLLDILIVFTTWGERQFSREIVERLKGFGARPWGGREITERWLARQLRPYGVRPRTMRIGEEVAKGYSQAEMADVFRRYVPRSELEAVKAEWKRAQEAKAEVRAEAEERKLDEARPPEASG